MANNPPDFGQGWGGTSDITMPAVMVTGFRIVGEAIVRRWNTPAGGLIDDPNYGYYLPDFLSGDLGPQDLARIATRAGAEGEKDERVQICATTVSLLDDGTLDVSARVTTGQGPFELVANVNQVTVSLLRVNPL